MDLINLTGAAPAPLDRAGIVSRSLCLRESCMRENCTYSLSGGRWPARKRATSDPTPAKRSNEGQGGPQETVEGRPLTKKNAEQPNSNRTPSRSNEPSGLDRVRQAAKEDKGLRFTALLHHVNVDLLRSSYQSLKKQAAAGVEPGALPCGVGLWPG